MSESDAEKVARLEAELEQARKVPYAEAAAAAVAPAVAEAGGGADAGASLAAMSTERPEPLPHEAEMDALMAQMRDLTERLASVEADAAHTRKSYAAAVAKLGPPEVAVYAAGIHAKLVSFRNAHPDLGGTFDQVIETAAPLAAAAKAVIAGDGQVADVLADLGDVVGAVEKFIARYPRRHNKPIDFSALVSDLEYATEAAEQLNAAA
jgi:hypothetical protein